MQPVNTMGDKTYEGGFLTFLMYSCRECFYETLHDNYILKLHM